MAPLQKYDNYFNDSIFWHTRFTGKDMSLHAGLEQRITQTFIIAIVIALIWMFTLINQPAAEIHRVNFGNQAQLVSVIPAPEKIMRGRNVEFVVNWWLLEPLPAGHTISYRLRNRQQDLALLDTTSIQTSGQPYASIPAGGMVFNDRISLPTPADATPGIYEVVAYLYPFENYALHTDQGSPIFLSQRTLFTVNITH